MSSMPRLPWPGEGKRGEERRVPIPGLRDEKPALLFFFFLEFLEPL